MLDRFIPGRHGRRVFAALVVGVLLCAGLATASPAGADTTLVQHVYNTSDEGLWLHPDAASLSSPLSDLMAEGTEFDVTCWVAGDDVNGDSIWDFGTDASTGSTGYAADFYIDTNTTQGSEGDQLTAQGVPQCGTSTSADSSGSQDTSSDTSGTQGMDLSRPCAGSVWIEDLQVEPLPNSNFKIIVTPNPELRDPIHAMDRDITVDMWHDIQSCVPGLYGGLADSIWQQLQCHQEFAVVPNLHGDWASGPTFDFESWHPALPNPGIGTYRSTHCLNNLGSDPGPATGSPMTPGEGYLDLAPIA